MCSAAGLGDERQEAGGTEASKSLSIFLVQIPKYSKVIGGGV
jgi:hypothetical protein